MRLHPCSRYTVSVAGNVCFFPVLLYIVVRVVLFFVFSPFGRLCFLVLASSSSRPPFFPGGTLLFFLNIYFILCIFSSGFVIETMKLECGSESQKWAWTIKSSLGQTCVSCALLPPCGVKLKWEKGAVFVKGDSGEKLASKQNTPDHMLHTSH